VPIQQTTHSPGPSRSGFRFNAYHSERKRSIVRQARNQTCLQQHTWNLKPQNTPTSPQFGARAMTENCDLLDDEWRIANMHALEIHHRSNQHHDLRSFQAGSARVQHIVGICTLHISLPFLLFSIQMAAPLRVSSSIYSSAT